MGLPKTKKSRKDGRNSIIQVAFAPPRSTTNLPKTNILLLTTIKYYGTIYFRERNFVSSQNRVQRSESVLIEEGQRSGADVRR